MNHLPIELIYEIIDLFDDEDDDDDCNNHSDGSLHSNSESSNGFYHPCRTLTTCALVCRAWNEVSRSRIFHKLTMDYIDLNDRLYFLHFDAPHLAPYILEVDLVWSGIGDEPADWVTTCFGSMKNLSRLRFSDRMSRSIKSQAPLGSAILTLLAAPLLRELFLIGWCFTLPDRTLDLIHLLSVLSPTLERLSFTSIFCPERTQSSAERIVLHMDHLHTVEFIGTGHDVLRQHYIECPDVQHVLLAATRAEKVWRLPMWIPSGLSRITIRMPTDNTVPEFGEYIRPSYMIIDVSESTSCSRCVIWIQNCINNFPFPNELRRLTISITIHLQYVRKFPDPIDYQVLTNVLQRLYKHGSLRHINLNIVLQGNGPIEAAFNQASEVEKLSNAFAMLLEAKALGIKLVFQRLWHRRTEVTSTCAIVA